MKSEYSTGIGYRIEAEAWAELADPTMSMDDFILLLKRNGAEILKVDPEGRRVLFLDRSASVGEVAWGCEKCPANFKRREDAEVHESRCG